MIFNSFGFTLLFLPLFVVAMELAKRIAGKRPEYREACKFVVIAFSLVFYAPFGLRNCAVLAASIVVNAAGAWALAKAGRSAENSVKALLAILITVNLAALLFFKFSGVFFPVAVSFYTFNQISYLVDLYKREIDRFEPVTYLAYILFFPKILQGPLMGYRAFAEQLDRACTSGQPVGASAAAQADRAASTATQPGATTTAARSSAETYLRALFLLSMGLFKKVILADTFGRAVDYGNENLTSLGSLEAILIAIFYSFQLYFDFSGYCDMAGAVCMMIGFDLPDNFNSPYKAVNIIDFWKRWHISLTRFFTKYVYIPLGGNRKGAVRMYINFMIVFLLSGLWHGSGWTFIVWGAMHGVLYVVTRAMKAANTAGKNRNTSKATAIKTFLTFIYVTIAWVFFRANTITDALTLLTRIFTGGSRRISTGISACFQLDELWYVIKVTPLMKFGFVWNVCLLIFLIASAVIIFFSKNAIEIARTCRIGVKTTLLTALLLVWSIVSFAGVSTFLYMNF